MRSNEFFLQNFELGFPFIISAMVKLPLFIEPEFTVADEFIVVEGSDGKRDLMVGFTEIFSIQEKGGVDYDDTVRFGDPVKFSYSFMETIQMLKNVRTVNLVKGIWFKGIREGIYIVDPVTAIVYDIEIYVTRF